MLDRSELSLEKSTGRESDSHVHVESEVLAARTTRRFPFLPDHEKDFRILKDGAHEF